MPEEKKINYWFITISPLVLAVSVIGSFWELFYFANHYYLKSDYSMPLHEWSLFRFFYVVILAILFSTFFFYLIKELKMKAKNKLDIVIAVYYFLLMELMVIQPPFYYYSHLNHDLIIILLKQTISILGFVTSLFYLPSLIRLVKESMGKRAQ